MFFKYRIASSVFTVTMETIAMSTGSPMDLLWCASKTRRKGKGSDAAPPSVPDELRFQTTPSVTGKHLANRSYLTWTLL